ncbi:NYN domain-containing protein [Pseudarthrobacter sp. J75]|uniref:NYN domain-containing protein n=1 Tax=unclassified Pseudarthrobacter TaxID=2647000 RepID=UPI002E81692D|nr:MULTISPECIES: NYN domain-containing protein [unclassified Pseudarthrobacter]MEE2524595.1 NYN domain-containing protein [Pseudarthrobacter sp. J47]MEE2530112.1 NYN domain-containing protein [Pseudarthrobacter sp. J75]MEE2570398.1 NYN domain-containing protein [Pseudarthrobacter sp. J64]
MAARSAIFVDAGYLLAVGGTAVAGTSLRSAFQVHYRSLIKGILDLTAEHAGLDDVLRVYWYDASPNGVFSDQHKQIGLIPDVKVRLGRISFNGEQKGVDLRLGLDLVGVARNQAAKVAYLVSGDDDLAEAVEVAQDLGMKVVLVGMENPDHRLGVVSVAEHLALQVDSILALSRELINECFTKQSMTPRPSVQHAPVPSAPGAPGAPAAILTAKPAPPSLGARPHAPVRLPETASELVYSSDRAGSDFTAGSDKNLITMAHEVGERVAASWFGTVTQKQLNDVLADRPILPPEIDRTLLKDCAQRMGEYNTDFQGVRRSLREAFWERLDQLA